jgi:hypothetical protein
MWSLRDIHTDMLSRFLDRRRQKWHVLIGSGKSYRRLLTAAHESREISLSEAKARLDPVNPCAYNSLLWSRVNHEPMTSKGNRIMKLSHNLLFRVGKRVLISGAADLALRANSRCRPPPDPDGVRKLKIAGAYQISPFVPIR